MKPIVAPDRLSAIVGTEVLQLQPGVHGTVQVVGGPCLRPLTFSERSVVLSGCCGEYAVSLAADLIAAAVSGKPAGDLNPALTALSLALCGAGLEAPSFSITAKTVAAAQGWSLEVVNQAPAEMVDRLVLAVHRPPDDGWNRIVFGSPETDPDAGTLVHELARQLLSRFDEGCLQLAGRQSGTEPDSIPSAVSGVDDNHLKGTMTSPARGTTFQQGFAALQPEDATPDATISPSRQGIVRQPDVDKGGDPFGEVGLMARPDIVRPVSHGREYGVAGSAAVFPDGKPDSPESAVLRLSETRLSGILQSPVTSRQVPRPYGEHGALVNGNGDKRDAGVPSAKQPEGESVACSDAVASRQETVGGEPPVVTVPGDSGRRVHIGPTLPDALTGRTTPTVDQIRSEDQWSLAATMMSSACRLTAASGVLHRDVGAGAKAQDFHWTPGVPAGVNPGERLQADIRDLADRIGMLLHHEADLRGLE